jgi:hypothetical protein
MGNYTGEDSTGDEPTITKSGSVTGQEPAGPKNNKTPQKKRLRYTTFK